MVGKGTLGNPVTTFENDGLVIEKDGIETDGIERDEIEKDGTVMDGTVMDGTANGEFVRQRVPVGLQ